MPRNHVRRLAPPIAAALILSSLGACCDNCSKEGKETAVTMSDVPAAVKATLERESKGGKVTEIEKETKNGKTVYSADITVNGKGWDITVGEDGSVISKEAEGDEKNEHHEKK